MARQSPHIDLAGVTSNTTNVPRTNILARKNPQDPIANTLETAFACWEEIFGFVPNVARAQRLLPGLIAAESRILKVLLLEHRVLSKTQKLHMLLAIAEACGDRYGVGLYTRALRVLNAQDSDFEVIPFSSGSGLRLLPASAALAEFAVTLAASPELFSAGDIAVLRRRGIADEGILEAIVVTALSRLLSTLSAALAPEPDVERPVMLREHFRSKLRRQVDMAGISRPYLRTTPLSSATATPFDFIQERFGFIPQVFKDQTIRPDLIDAEANLIHDILEPANFLSPSQKESILLRGTDPSATDLCRNDEALLNFIRKVAAGPVGCGRADLDSLQAHGFQQEHLLEAIVVLAVRNFLTTVQTGLGTSPDLDPDAICETAAPQGHDAPERLAQEADADPDRELVTRVQGGDLDAFEVLVNRHSRRVFRTLMAVMESHQEAQDATQDTFLKAFQHIRRFEYRSKFSTWLLAIASNNALQRLRERKPLERLDDINDEGEFRPRYVAAWRVDPEHLYSLAERRTLVESGLRKLPSKYRVVVVLRDIEQLSIQEAASVLGLGHSALKARHFRARLMLRDTLSAHFTIGAQTPVS